MKKPPEFESSSPVTTGVVALVKESIELECVGPRWKKGPKCPPSLVLFATDGKGLVQILDHAGPDAAYLNDEDQCTQDAFVRDELATHPFPGIWVWEGVVQVTRDYWGEYDETYPGEVRPLNEEERERLLENDDPWDRSIWLEEP